MKKKKFLLTCALGIGLFGSSLFSGGQASAASIPNDSYKPFSHTASKGAQGGTLYNSTHLGLRYDYGGSVYKDRVDFSGYQTVSATSSTKPSKIYLRPKQSVYHSTYSTSVGLPAGVSQSKTNTSTSVTWPSITISNTSSGTRYWDSYSVTASKITRITATDLATFVFGSTAYDVSTSLSVTTSRY